MVDHTVAIYDHFVSLSEQLSFFSADKGDLAWTLSTMCPRRQASRESKRDTGAEMRRPSFMVMQQCLTRACQHVNIGYHPHHLESVSWTTAETSLSGIPLHIHIRVRVCLFYLVSVSLITGLSRAHS